MDGVKQTKFDNVTTGLKANVKGGGWSLGRPRPLTARTLLPVAAVVAGGILLHILTSINLLASFWQSLTGMLAFFGQDLIVPLWLVVALGATSLLSLTVTALRVGSAYLAARRAGNPYVGDRIFDLDWQWRWDGDDPVAATLTPLCPHCAYELSSEASPQPDSFGGSDVTLSCESCSFSKRFDVGPSELLERIGKEIRRRARLNARA